MHYFSCSGRPGAVSIKSMMGHVTLNLCFYIRWDLRDHIAHSSASGERNMIALFFKLEWDRYTELVF
jgi:hypothetical protein